MTVEDKYEKLIGKISSWVEHARHEEQTQCSVVRWSAAFEWVLAESLDLNPGEPQTNLPVFKVGDRVLITGDGSPKDRPRAKFLQSIGALGETAEILLLPGTLRDGMYQVRVERTGKVGLLFPREMRDIEETASV